MTPWKRIALLAAGAALVLMHEAHKPPDAPARHPSAAPGRSAPAIPSPPERSTP